MPKFSLKQLNFNLIPSEHPQVGIHSSDVIDNVMAEDIYRQAHRAVYNAWPKNSLGQNWRVAVDNAKTVGLDFKSFCLYVIAGHRVTHDINSQFLIVNLTSPTSFEKIKSLREACSRRYNATDIYSLGLVLDIHFYDIDDEMTLSETNFGHYIAVAAVNSIADPYEYIYDREETALSPYWLAIEDTYKQKIFMPYLEKLKKVAIYEKHTLGSDGELRQRHLVAQITRALKNDSSLASTVFASRSRAMPKAAKTILSRFYLTASSPICYSQTVTDACTFWVEVGEACAEATAKWKTDNANLC